MLMQARNSIDESVVRRGKRIAGTLSVILACSIAGTSQTQKGTAVNPKMVQREGFTVVGIAVRTSNSKEATPEGAIGKQWARLMGEKLLEKIPNKADGNIVALYTEYASDKDGEYTYLLGARVTKVDVVPAGMVVKNVPAGRYTVFTSEEGPVQKVVAEMWQRVWGTPKNELGGERAYKADFEVYDQRAQNPADSIVDLYVGIR